MTAAAAAHTQVALGAVENGAELASQVLGALHPTQPIYAVLDGARDPLTDIWIRSTKAPAWCLYRGELSKEMEAAAPWLVRLGRGHAYTEELFRDGWGKSRGVLFASDAPSKELRRHLRRFFRVRTDSKKRVIVFRWYDPRVLRVYLPTCTQAEQAGFFGPITAFGAESEDGRALHRFAAPPPLPAGEVAPDGSLRRPLVIRDAQLQVLQADFNRRYVLPLLRERHRAMGLSPKPSPAADARMLQEIARAQLLGIDKESQLAQLTSYSLQFSGWDERPEIAALLAAPKLAADDRLQRIHQLLSR